MKNLFIFMVLLFTSTSLYAESKDNGNSYVPESNLASIRTVLTTEVIEREPKDEKDEFLLATRTWLFTDIRGGKKGDFIYHVWYYHENEETTYELARIKLNIGSSRWRTWSNKQLTYPGEWSVEVVDYNGEVLDTRYFTVKEKIEEKVIMDDNAE